MKIKLVWNVFIHDFNSKQIEVFNIFEHGRFKEDLKRLKKEGSNDLKEAVKRLLMYCFWSKAEYEVIITSWPPYITKKEYERITDEISKKDFFRVADVDLETAKKVDIYEQMMLNYDIFYDYLMSHWEEV